jgi:hypothetical protein
MKRHYLLTLVLTASIAAYQPVHAGDEHVTVTVFGGSVHPLASFGSKLGDVPAITRRSGFDIGSDAGLAGTGWFAGVEFRNTVLLPEFSWVISARVLTNSSDAGSVSGYFGQALGDTIGFSADIGRWWNIPMMSGFAYTLPVADDITISAVAQAGINISRQPARKFYVKDLLVEETSFNFMSDFGFEIGAGIELSDRYSFSVRYMNLGAPRYDGSRRLNEKYFAQIARRVTYIQGDERSISMVTLLLGIRIW